jgi:hypothetical protein
MIGFRRKIESILRRHLYIIQNLRNGLVKLVLYNLKNMLKKIMVYSGLLLAVLLLGIAVYFQYKAEKHIKEVNDEYSFFEEKNRLSYEPFVFFYLSSKVWSKEKNAIFWDSIIKPYEEKGLLDGKTTVRLNIELNAYMMKCYNTAESLQNSLPPH